PDEADGDAHVRFARDQPEWRPRSNTDACCRETHEGSPFVGDGQPGIESVAVREHNVDGTHCLAEPILAPGVGLACGIDLAHRLRRGEEREQNRLNHTRRPPGAEEAACDDTVHQIAGTAESTDSEVRAVTLREAPDMQHTL